VSYRVLADLVVALHFGFVLFVVFGGLFVFRRRWTAWLHVPAAVWGALIEVSGGICPLTPLENWLRRESGAAGYSGGFIEHYILPVLYPVGLTRQVQLLLGFLVILLNLTVYWLALRRA
jgi:hypothetical protein